MDTYTGQDVLDESAYKRRYQRYLPAGRNADNDTARNLAEWEGLTLTGVNVECDAAYTDAGATASDNTNTCGKGY